jgi:hypothetical protein
MSYKNWHEECDEPGFWIDVVQSYGRCSITKPGDRLIAIAGVAKSLQPVVNDTYLTGLWRRDLVDYINRIKRLSVEINNWILTKDLSTNK